MDRSIQRVGVRHPIIAQQRAKGGRRGEGLEREGEGKTGMVIQRGGTGRPHSPHAFKQCKIFWNRIKPHLSCCPLFLRVPGSKEAIMV